MMQRNSFEFDGLFDWILKKEGKEAALASQLVIEHQNEKPPMGRPLEATRNSKDRFREERKETRASLGA
jgi:hypothetical protein